MIANKRLPKISLATIVDRIVICLMPFALVGLILEGLGIITTDLGPKIISMIAAITLMLNMFVGNYFTKAKNEKDSVKSNCYVAMLSLSCIVPAMLIVDLLALPSDIKHMAILVIATFVWLINWKIEKMRLKQN